MALSCKSGFFTCPSVTGTNAVTGLGFQPKALILWGSRYNTPDTYGASSYPFIGVASGTATAQNYALRNAIEALDPTDSTSLWRTGKCMSIAANTATADTEAILSSFDADGFTLNFSATVASSLTAGYFAVGGSDLTAAKVGTITAATAGSSVSVTGVGGTPTGVLFFWTRNGADNAVENIAYFGLGAAAGSVTSKQAAIHNIDNDTQPTSQSWHTQRHGKAGVGMGVGGGADWDITLASFDADGFTVTVNDNPNASVTIGYLALVGPQVNVGVSTQPSVTGTSAVTGVGFQPTGLLLVNSMSVASAGTASSYSHSIGTYDGTTSFASLSTAKDAQAVTIPKRFQSHSNAIVSSDLSTTTVAKAAGSSLDSDGFTLNWTTVDATAREFVYVALGSAAVVGGGGSSSGGRAIPGGYYF